MNKTQRILWPALLLASTLAFTGCGFAAKNLAKQVSDLTKKAADIEKQAAELQGKAADIEEKAAALSPKDRREYQEELARLGFEPQDWLFGDAEALASGAPAEDTEDYTGGGSILELVGGLFGGRSSGGTTAPPTTSDDTAPAAPPTTAGEPIASAAPPTTAPTTAPASGSLTWTAVADNIFGDSQIDAIAFGNNRWVAVGVDGKMAYSADGRSWTAVALSPFGTSEIRDIAWGNNRFVAGGDDGRMAYSADGVTWTAIDVYIAFGRSSISAIAYGNNRWVAIGGGKVAYSTDGINWTAFADIPFSFNAIAYGTADNAGGRYVAVGDEGRMAYSADGRSWTDVADRTVWDWNWFGTIYTVNINAIAYGTADNAGGRYVAVGDEGKMAYSSDGVSWTAAVDSAFGESSINAVAYGNSRFVAVNENGRIAYADW